MNRWLLTITLLATLMNCHSDNSSDDSITPVHGQGLPGTWQLFERGYSPGAGYIIDKIPAKPEQSLTFTADGSMQAQGDGLSAYQAFNQFRLDTTNKMVLIHFASTTSSNHAERVYLSNDTLRLYQSCYEGCHLGFLRIK